MSLADRSPAAGSPTVPPADLPFRAQRQNLFPFVWKAFEHIHPGQRLVPYWHVEAMCHALEGVASGRTRRLLITVPPRHGKSICTAVCLPAFLLGHDPTTKIMVASYGGSLAQKHARDTRTVLAAPWYERLFPRTRLMLGGNRVDEQITTKGGGRMAVSVGGAVTGFGADLIIVDDLMKAADASSPVERQRVIDFYEQTLLSRLNNKNEGRIVVIAQRLHEDDLPGHLIASGQFAHLNLPAIAVEDERIAIGFGRHKRRRKDEVLWPECESAETLEGTRGEMGAAAFSAQYQQDPTPPGGNRAQWEWFGTYKEMPERATLERVVQSWDTAMTGEPTSDFSVGTTWGYRDGHWYLLDVARERLDFPDLKKRVAALAAKWRADRVLIEEAGSGYALLQQLRVEERTGRRLYQSVTPRLDKQTRFEAQTARMETGAFLVPAQAPWLEAFRRELLAFPSGRHDDHVDSLVQFLEWTGLRRGRAFLDTDPATGRRRMAGQRGGGWPPA